MILGNGYVDTIVALATAPGEAAIHVIRLSGFQAKKIINSCFVPKNTERWNAMAGFTLHLGWFKDDNGKNIDQVLVSQMLSPLSYTGEDVIEISCHGGFYIAQRILEVCIKGGARLAEPGEFTKRAFLNGKLDLVQAEGIIDLINARNNLSADLAVTQLNGMLSSEIIEVREQVLEILAYIEAGIDFPEDDVEDLNREELKARLERARKFLKKLLMGSRTGRILREGLMTVIVGKPNVGKSSLLNALVKEERAIVTDIPGTTRDEIREYVSLGGIPLLLVDTAGIRESLDPIERIGIKRSWQSLEKADLVLLLIEAGSPPDEEEKLIIQRYSDKIIVLINKVDLYPNFAEEGLDLPCAKLKFSVVEHIGFKELEREIQQRVFQGKVNAGTEPLLANIRHIIALEKADSALQHALDALKNGLPWDILSIDVRQSLAELSSVTGQNIEDSLLDDIFSRFCIGK